MLHPNTRVQLINDEVGSGVVATTMIPKGTIVYCEDPLDIVLAPDHPLIQHPSFAATIETYSYRDATGSYVICWDGAKYINHACNPSTLTTGYGFEIAIRDIYPGEEITDDYAIYNCPVFGPLRCGEPDCRGEVRPDDFDRLCDTWDRRIRDALRFYTRVEQPLEPYLREETRATLRHHLQTGKDYRSITHARLVEIDDTPPTWLVAGDL
ncbi:MAG: SET domain-containing protein [Phycisphaerales bacterium JB063]